MSSLMKMFAERFQKLRDELEQTQVVGEAGAGMVRVTVNGQREVVGIEISPEAVSPDNAAMLEDLILAACTDGQRKAGELIREKLGPLTGGLQLPPGLFS